MVVLPDHLHALLTIPQNDPDYSTRWALIKAGFSRQVPNNERINKSRQSKGERGNNYISEDILTLDWGNNTEEITDIEVGGEVLKLYVGVPVVTPTYRAWVFV